MPVAFEFLHSVTDTLKIGLVVIDPDNRIVLFNRTAGTMLQQDPLPRLGSTILSCHPRESAAAVEQLIEDIKAEKIDHYEGWVNYKGRMLYEYIYPLRDPQGRYAGMVEELHDAADRAELMKRLGVWKDVHVSAIGARAPRAPEGGLEVGPPGTPH